MPKRKYVRNVESGVIFPATPALIEGMDVLGLVYANADEYRDQEEGVVAEQEVDTPDKDPNKITMMVEAIAGLDPLNMKDFNKDGLPNAKTISMLTGSRVTTQERDEAWAIFQEEG